MNLSVAEARAQLVQRLCESVTGHDRIGVPGFEALDERVRSLEQAVDDLVVARIRTALESMPTSRAQAAQEP